MLLRSSSGGRGTQLFFHLLPQNHKPQTTNHTPPAALQIRTISAVLRPFPYSTLRTSRDSKKAAVGGTKSPTMKVTFKVCSMLVLRSCQLSPNACAPCAMPLLPHYILLVAVPMLIYGCFHTGSQATEVYDRCRADRSCRLPLIVLQRSPSRPVPPHHRFPWCSCRVLSNQVG